MAAWSQPTGAGASTGTYPNVARGINERAKWFKDNHLAISTFAVASKRAQGVPNLDEFKHSQNLKRTCAYLDLLEFDTNMSPELKGMGGIENALNLIVNNPEFHFPDDVKQRAAMLLQRFTNENWGAPAAVDNSSNSGSPEEVTSPSTPAATAATAAMRAAPGNATATIMRFPADDQIWGQRGIMHHILPKVSGGVIRSRSIDPDYARPSAKVSGDNGLAVGEWWPYRVCALRDGAHGESQAGISGSVADGAHSVVVAGAYEGVDEDHGDMIWYSAPGSADTENRNETARNSGTTWLSRSLVTGNSVRVLRSANRKSAYAPSVGLRYDGLYVVVEQDTSRNDKGGLFIRYRLRRLPGQKPLVDVMRDSPTAQQMADFRRAKDLR